MIRRAAIAAAALWLASCASVPPPRESPGAAWNLTHQRLDSLGAEGRLSEALALADTARARHASPTWLAEDFAATHDSWRRRVEAPDSVRAALSEADRAQFRIEAMMRRDSVAAAHALAAHAAQVRARWLGSHDPSVLRSGVVSAEIAFRLGRGAEAESLLARVREGIPAAWAGEHPLRADVEELTGRVLKNFHGLTREAEARAAYERARAIRARAFGERSLEVAELHQQIGNLDRAARRPGEALAHFQKALEIRRERWGPRHEDVASTLSAIAFLHAATADWKEAERSMRGALAADPDSARMAPLTRSTRLGFLGQAMRRTGRGREAIPLLASAAAAAETVWSRMPQDGSASVHAGLSVYRELAMALAADGRDEEAFEQLERGQSRLWVASAASDPWDGLLARVRAALGDDAALVCWPRTNFTPPGGDYPMWACVVRSRGPVRWVRLDRDPAVSVRGTGPREALLGEIIRGARWPLRLTDVRAVDSLGMLMGRERIGPLEPHLAGVRRLVVAGPDLMIVSPLCMLRDANGVRLGDRFQIVYAPSALAWVTLTERSRGRPVRDVHHALLVGAPASAPADSGRWAPLGGATGEMSALARIFPEAIVLAGADASAERLRSLARGAEFADLEVIHLATHMDIDAARGMQSAFVLAPDRGRGGVSSRLSAAEIAAEWRVNASVVSLAGCRSALGFTTASEGPLGLHRAFLTAGARNVLVSNWWVDDEATSRLMQEFHRRLVAPGGAREPARALSEAQRAVREWRAPDGRTPFAHPVYWAGFAVVGAG